MSRIGYFIIGAMMLVLTSFTPPDLPKSFTDLLSRADMMFEAPKGMVPAPVVYNRAAPYQYALKYPDKNFEVRYSIRPADSLWKQYEDQLNSGKRMDVNTDPDSSYLSAFETIILNTSKGEFPKINDFDPLAVKAEFNADWGGTVALHPRKEFTPDYKYCMIVCIHKSHAGDAYIFYLSDTPEGFDQLRATAFHSLIFNRL